MFFTGIDAELLDVFGEPGTYKAGAAAPVTAQVLIEEAAGLAGEAVFDTRHADTDLTAALLATVAPDAKRGDLITTDAGGSYTITEKLSDDGLLVRVAIR